MAEKKKKNQAVEEEQGAQQPKAEANGGAVTLEDLQKQISEDQKLIEELTAQSADYKDKWYRSVAEFENYKKRNAETRKNAYEEGKTDTLKKILFIGDNVERALSYDIDENTKQGLNMLLRQYKEILVGMGLEEIDPKGGKFDPNLHEAIFTKPCEEGQEAGTVDSVFLKGYKMGDKIIRYAQVVVIKQ